MVTKTQDVRLTLIRRSMTYEGTSTPPALTAQSVSVNWTDSVTHDGPVAGYRQKISQVKDATSGLSGNKRKFAYANGHMYVKYRRKDNPQRISVSEMDGACIVPSVPSFPGGTGLAVADNGAKQAFVKRAMQELTAIQGGVFLGELRETLGMIRRPAQALRRGVSDYFSSLRKRRRGTEAHRRRALSGTWLEYSFGWQPLLNDIDDGCRALANLRVVRGAKRITASHDVRTPIGTSFSPLDLGNCHSYVASRTEDEDVVIYRGAVLANSPKPAYMARQNFGFTLDNFVPTLWELVPYSFLVDYFTNIGEILQGWSFCRANLAWINRTALSIRHLEQRQVAWKPDDLDALGWLMDDNSFSPANVKAESRIVNRATYSGSLVPSLEFQIPGFGSTKWLNLAALAASHRSLTPY